MAGKEQGGPTDPEKQAEKCIAALKMSDALQRQIVNEAEKEFKRRQGFKRIFPSIDYQYYRQFFVEERPLNVLLD